MTYTINDFITNCKAWHRSYIQTFKDTYEAAAAQLIARGEFTPEYLDGLSDGLRY